VIELVLASGNLHKAEEINSLLDNGIFQVLAPKEKIEVDENGDSFEKNAYLKANAYYQLEKSPVLSDDSGLIVEVLPGELGIHSARFGGEGLDDRGRAELLLEKMKDVPEENRSAYFVCFLCFYLSKDEVYFFEGRLSGSIGTEYSGSGGFGYDPVFIPKKGVSGLSLASQTDFKDKNSHRALACLAANKFFSGKLGLDRP
jgi:XTP/dITP diphosphohydrolase